MEERRMATLDNILESLGEIKQIANHNQHNIEGLLNRITVQNNRIGKLELFCASAKGVLIVVTVLLIPAFVRAFSVWFQWMMGK